MFCSAQALRDLAGLISRGVLSRRYGMAGQTFLHAQLGSCDLLLLGAVCVGSCLLLRFLTPGISIMYSRLSADGCGMCIP